MVSTGGTHEVEAAYVDGCRLPRAFRLRLRERPFLRLWDANGRSTQSARPLLPRRPYGCRSVRLSLRKRRANPVPGRPPLRGLRDRLRRAFRGYQQPPLQLAPGLAQLAPRPVPRCPTRIRSRNRSRSLPYSSAKQIRPSQPKAAPVTAKRFVNMGPRSAPSPEMGRSGHLGVRSRIWLYFATRFSTVLK